MYGIPRIVLIAVGVLAGMIVAGAGHQAASIVSHVSSPVFHHPLIAFSLIIGIAFGLWLGGERTIHDLGEAEKNDIRKAIKSVR